MNNLINQNYTQQEKVFVMNNENTKHGNEKRRRKHQLFIDVFNNKKRI